MNTATISAADMQYMALALKHAQAAFAAGEFPVGCVIAGGDSVVACGHRTGTANNVGNEIDHAEINALRELNRTRLTVDRSTLTLYCTMEPCLMCFSAIVLSGIARIVFAYEDVMGGGTGCDRSTMAPLYRDAQLTVIPGVLRENSLSLFQRFFTDPGNDYWVGSQLYRYTMDQLVSP